WPRATPVSTSSPPICSGSGWLTPSEECELMIRTKRSSAALLGLLLVAACHNDELNRPFADTPVDPLFARYVSMGNSITAGVQAAGINDSTQQQSYTVVLARAMRSPFFPPLLRRPGCPPPYTNVFTRTRLTPPGFPASTDSSC